MSSEFPSPLNRLRRVLADTEGRGVSDADLLSRYVLHRDEAAFELLCWRHAGLVMGVCRAVLRDHHLAEDAFQAAFLTLARKAGSINRTERLSGWLHRVACHAALKARARKARDSADPLVEEPAAPETSLPDDLTPILHDEIAKLPDRYRLPIVLCCLEGRTHAEAARELGWPIGTVAGRLSRAREVLRGRLERRGAAAASALVGTALAPSISTTLVAGSVRTSLDFVSGNAAVVSAPVLRLSEGVIRAMFLTKLKSIALAGVVIVCVTLGGLGGLALAQKTNDVDKPAAVDPSKKEPKAVADLKERSILNLKQIALAAHNHHDSTKYFPSDIVDKNKKPLLSWRVAILPYLEQDDLYKQFKLDETWDSAHNLKLLEKMPAVYRIGTEPRGATSTHYQGFAGADTLFPAGGEVTVAGVTDGLSNTLFVVEASAAVPWTKPADLIYAADKPVPKIGGVFKDATHAALADGSVHPLTPNLAEKQLRRLITRNDGEVVEVEKLRAYAPPAPKPIRKPDRLEAALEAEARARAEAEAMAEHARAMADKTQQLLLQTRKESDRIKTGLREILDRLEFLDRKPVSKEAKELAAEMESTRAELKQLREQVKKLEQSLGK